MPVGIAGRNVVSPWELRGCVGAWLPEPEYVVTDGSGNVSFVNSLVPASRRVALEQAVAVNRPGWTASNAAFSGRPTLDFDGATSLLHADSLAAQFAGEDQPYTQLFAVEWTSGCVASLGANASDPFDELFQPNPNQPRTIRRDDTSAGADNVGSGLPAKSVLEWVMDGTTVTVLANASSVGIDGAAYDVGQCTFTRYTVGALRRNSVARELAGSIAFAAIYNRALSAAERRIARTWMQRRFGL